MLLVTKSKYGRTNQLGYDKRNGEYVYFHNGVEQWRIKGDSSLFNYFDLVRNGYKPLDDDKMKDELKTTFAIWEKYFNDCTIWEQREHKI